MANIWKKSGVAGEAHWIKINGEWSFTAACGKIVGRSDALPVPSVPTGLANKPGIYVDLPDYDEPCEECKRKAIEQA